VAVRTLVHRNCHLKCQPRTSSKKLAAKNVLAFPCLSLIPKFGFIASHNLNHSPLFTAIIHYHIDYTITKTTTRQEDKTRQDVTSTKPFARDILPLSLHPRSHEIHLSIPTISIMMIYQQTMLSSTIEQFSFSSHRPSLSSSWIERRKISSSSSSSSQESQDVRSVNFSSCTKKQEAQEKQASSGVKRMNSSRSVPIPECCMFRTPSELQLTVDEQVADQRDFAFFARLVSGISERRASSTTSSTTNAACATETDRCLTHIIQTRHHTQSHDEQEDQEEAQHCCDGILIEDDDSSNQVEGEGVFYLGADNDCFTSSSSSSSSSSLYQHEFVDYEDEAHTGTHSSNDDHDDLYNEGGDCDCMFDLEL